MRKLTIERYKGQRPIILEKTNGEQKTLVVSHVVAAWLFKNFMELGFEQVGFPEYFTN